MQDLKQICCEQAVHCLSTADFTDEGWEKKKKQEFTRGVKQFAKFEKLATLGSLLSGSLLEACMQPGIKPGTAL